MTMVGVGVGVSAGPLVIHARFTKPNHVAITNAMQLFVRPSSRRSFARTHFTPYLVDSSSERSEVPLASPSASPSLTPK